MKILSMRPTPACGFGDVSKTASPMVLMMRSPWPRQERARSANRRARLAASSSPCSSVRAVKPARSTKQNVASIRRDDGEGTLDRGIRRSYPGMGRALPLTKDRAIFASMTRSYERAPVAAPRLSGIALRTLVAALESASLGSVLAKKLSRR